MYKNIECNFPTYIPQYLISNRDKLEVVQENLKITNTTKIIFEIEKDTASKYMSIEKYISKLDTIIATLFCNNKIFIFSTNKVLCIDEEKNISRISIDTMDKNTLQNAFVSLGDKIYYFVNNKINILDTNTMKVSFIDLNKNDYKYYFASVISNTKIIFANTCYSSDHVIQGMNIYDIENNTIIWDDGNNYLNYHLIYGINQYFTYWGDNGYFLNKETDKFYNTNSKFVKNISNYLSTNNCICTLFFDRLFILNKDDNSIWCMNTIDSDPYLLKEADDYKTISFFINSNTRHLCILTEDLDIIEYYLYWGV